MDIRQFLFIGLLLFSALAEGQSLLWQIEGNGLTKPSYLFGTLHLGSKQVINFDSTVIEKMQSCDAFAMELNPDSYESYELFQLLQLPDSLLATNLLDSQQNSILDSAFNTLGAGNGASLKAFYPIVVSTLFVQSSLESNNVTQVSVDIYLRQRAQWAGLKVYSLEKLDEQARVLKAIPIKEQYEELLAVIQGDSETEDLTLLESYYLNQQLMAMYHYTLENGQWKNGMDSLLLDQRNEVMLERTLNIWENQSVFITVGAAHLPGKNGLIELFRKHGYQVTPIKFEFNK